MKTNRLQFPLRFLALLVLTAACPLSATALPAVETNAAKPQILVLRGGTVFDSLRGELVPDETIIIRGDRIETVGPEAGLTKLPKGAQVIDAHGKFIIPGLMDAHIHLAHELNPAHMTGEETLPMFLACGVTSLRDIGDSINPERVIANYARAHPESCPRIFMCSPLIDGFPVVHPDNTGYALTNANDVPAFVKDMAAWGVTSLKIYVGTPRAVGREVIKEAHKRHLMVGGHLGLYSAQDAVTDGIDSLEHIWSVFDYIIPDGPRPYGYRATMDLTTPKAHNLITNIVAHHTMVDPTLIIFRNAILMPDLEEVYNNPDIAHMPARARNLWNRYHRGSSLGKDTFAVREGEFKNYQKLTGILYRAGATILAGTDTPEPYCVPGFALLDELDALVGSGMPPAAVLQSATINNAAAVKQESQLGSITPGKFADLVILSANPLTDIRNVRKIEKVIHQGIVCDPVELLKLVPRE